MKPLAELIVESGSTIDDVIAEADVIAEYGRVAERERIAKIIKHGIETDNLASALQLAFQSELSAADAISLIDAKQSADVVRPH